MAGHLEIFFDTQGLPKLVVEQALWKFKRHAVDGLEGSWEEVMSAVEGYKMRTWGNVPVALRAIHNIRERIAS